MADVVREGMLDKLSGEYGGKSKYKWDNRFVWLTSQGMNWGKKDKSYDAVNTLPLDEIESAQYFGQFLDHDNVFFLYTKVKDNKKYFFACRSGEECRQWVMDVQKMLQALKSQGK
ncbi:Pleckstrin_homology domain [Hexamita inflata]|uniref:Pleckstrin homology domain n=1 Tax=Hexamita inflata TaxID=28002 RepID=A0AA86U361_9EUKA|nr:Pleckstrin homology domain [Hexamita inflata]CAI9938754.1 Pleckstrin homology domain [Hexamita inflata]CAI9942948.1 Pleckstrin homology domain [Hexamita inflata]